MGDTCELDVNSCLGQNLLNSEEDFVICIGGSGYHSSSALIDFGFCLADCPDITECSSLSEVQTALRCGTNCAYSTADQNCNATLLTTTSTTSPETTTSTSTTATTTTTTTTTSDSFGPA